MLPPRTHRALLCLLECEQCGFPVEKRPTGASAHVAQCHHSYRLESTEGSTHRDGFAPDSSLHRGEELMSRTEGIGQTS